MTVQVGVARTCLNPWWGVELTGWGYYLQRTWIDVHDSLHATALVIENKNSLIAIVSLDLMVISDQLTRLVRDLSSNITGIAPGNILVCCTHTHNAPASGGLLGVGEVDPSYEEWAAKQASTAVICAWRSQETATFRVGQANVADLTYNRTRENGPIDPTLTVLRADRNDGSPLAVLVGFQGHPTVSTVLRPRSVSRDIPGEVCNRIEDQLPGCTALYVQGACGDVNFLREFSNPRHEYEPAEQIASAAIQALEDGEALNSTEVRAKSKLLAMPTRRWTQQEIDADRVEAEHRLQHHDTDGWRDSIGRVMTNRPDDMVARHGGNEWKAVEAMCRFNMQWTDRILRDLEDRPESLETEIQALRIGPFVIVSNASEFFTTPAMQVREQVDTPYLTLACYANGRIGYVPDKHDVQRRTYAAYQSPKYCNQFPFTETSGLVMADAMSELVNEITHS